jgi:hypothetical protein
LQDVLGDVLGFHPRLLSIIEEKSGQCDADQQMQKSNAESDPSNIVLVDAVCLDELYDVREAERTLRRAKSLASVRPSYINEENIKTVIEQLKGSQKKSWEKKSTTPTRYIPILNCPQRTVPKLPFFSNHPAAENIMYRVVTVSRWASAAVDLNKLSNIELSFFGGKFCDLFCFKSGLLEREHQDFFHSKEYRLSVDALGKTTRQL